MKLRLKGFLIAAALALPAGIAHAVSYSYVPIGTTLPASATGYHQVGTQEYFLVKGSTVAIFSSTGSYLLGGTAGQGAPTGFVGESNFSYNSTNPALPGSTLFLNIATSSVLAAGDWDIWANIQAGAGTPAPTLAEIQISTETGTGNVMGTQRGYNSTFINISSNTVGGSGFGGFLMISTATSASTTWFVRLSATYTGTAPNARGAIFWRRR